MAAPTDADVAALELAALRDDIERLDRELLALLARRLGVVERVVAAKLAAASAFRDRLREDSLIARLRDIAIGHGLDPHQIDRLYRVVMDMSVAHQEQLVRTRRDMPLRVAYQGVEGSYSHLAAQRRYAGRAGGALLVGHDSFRAAARAVADQAADLALLPIENSTAGSISETYDALRDHALHITGEVIAAIEHCLLVRPGVALDELRVVMSHPQALAQCHAFFARNPHLAPRAELDTAGAARRVASAGDRALAAIASSAAAQTYGLAILERGINTAANNQTRFVEIAPRPAPLGEGVIAKTSLVLALADRPGALGEILSRFAARGLSLTKIESRPIPERAFTYRFYIDVLGHAAAPAFAAALEELGALTTELRVLGSYAAATLD